MRRGKWKLKKQYWRQGKSKYLIPRLLQEGYIFDADDFQSHRDKGPLVKRLLAKIREA